MKTEIMRLVQQAQEASDDLRTKISELHLRVRSGLPPEELELVEAELRRLEGLLAKQITKDSERMTRNYPPPGGLLPAS